MNIRIALAGNPNSGKTTLFNALTGSNQFVGNWPGVTVEKKEGKLKKDKEVIITDLPGIYSLSPYSSEEVVARNYLIHEKVDVILNIVDGSNLERNLYLTTQLLELDIPVVMAINMMDVVKKNGDQINTKELSKQLGIPVYEISALNEIGINQVIQACLHPCACETKNIFSKQIEDTLSCIENQLSSIEKKRWHAIKVFERDEKIMKELNLAPDQCDSIEKIIQEIEQEYDDDSESIVTNERYEYISTILSTCYKKNNKGKLSTSDKIDRIITNRVLGLPIFALVMFLVYWIAMGPFGTMMTDWANDGVFGDGWHLLGIGGSQYEQAMEQYGNSTEIIDGFMVEYGNENMVSLLELDALKALDELYNLTPENTQISYEVIDEETLDSEVFVANKKDLEKAIHEYTNVEYKQAFGQPDTSTYGIWIPGIPVLVNEALEKLEVSGWLSGLINDGIVAGVGAVLGFVPQMLILFFMLAFLESCGYMTRIAFVLDRVFRKFGLSGKSFIPMLIGTGCGVPGIMASRTIENENDRRMTIITTTFIPCGAKIPFIAMIAGALFNHSAWISTMCYFIGMAAIIVSGIILKKTKPFSGDTSPFVMELPSYHMPTLKNLLHSMWERGWSFIKKAGSVILLSTIIIWFTTYFGFVEGTFRMLEEYELSHSLLASIGNMIAWIFKPLGWGNWQASVASITGLVAKENIVGTMGVIYSSSGNVYHSLSNAFTSVTGLSFLVFNLLCAPCFAAIGAIKREMNNTKWTCFAILYQCGFAYAIAFMITQFGNVLTGTTHFAGLIIAFIVLIAMVYMLFIKKGEANNGRI